MMRSGRWWILWIWSEPKRLIMTSRVKENLFYIYIGIEIFGVFVSSQLNAAPLICLPTR